jgi:hypothetical protein
LDFLRDEQSVIIVAHFNWQVPKPLSLTRGIDESDIRGRGGGLSLTSEGLCVVPQILELFICGTYAA